MEGMNQLVMCMAEAKAALTMYLNEHVMTGEHRSRVVAIAFDIRDSVPVGQSGSVLVLTLEQEAPAEGEQAGGKATT